MATIADVAKRAGVAVSTASYALNGSDKVSEKTREKVLQAAIELNFTPNSFAQNLKKNKNDLIALIVHDISGPFYDKLVKGIQDVAGLFGYNVVIFCEAMKGKDMAYRFLKDEIAEGAIILSSSITDEQIEELSALHLPIVLLDRTLSNSDICSVLVDNRKGAHLAVKHLADLGHERIGFISGSEDSFDNRERLKGFFEAMEQNGLKVDERLILKGNFTEESGYKAMSQFLKSASDLPTAFFSSNDEMMIGAIRAIEEAGYHVPEDFSLIGFDDIPLASYVPPLLTTIRRPTYELGSISAHILFSLMNGLKKSSSVTLDVELIVRGSTQANRARVDLAEEG